MLSVEERYYKLNRTLLKLLGLWPYSDSKWVKVQMILTTILCLSTIFVQFAVFITHEFTIDLVLSVLSFIFPSIFAFLMYLVHYFCSDTFKKIMEHIYDDWELFKSIAEFNILDNYASATKLFTEVFFFILIFCMSVITSFYAAPIFLDVVLPLNESRQQIILMDLEYFLDPVKYLNLIIVHMMTFTFLAALTVLATGSTLYGYFLHACAMFKIANYQMKKTIDKDVLQISSPEREHVILNRLIYAIKVHRRNLLFVHMWCLYCDMLLLHVNRPFLVVIVIGVSSLSICLFRMLQAILMLKSIADIFISFAFLFVHISYIFFSNHLGQQITKNNAEIFDTVYNLPWYLVSLNIQKLILFLLQKGNKDFIFTIGGIYDASYEGFSTLITTSISYFTVIYTVH